MVFNEAVAAIKCLCFCAHLDITMEAPPPLSDSYRDSSYTNITWTTGRPKSIAGADFYDRSRFSKWVALSGLLASFFVSVACAFFVFITKGTVLGGMTAVTLKRWWQGELVSLGINLLVTLCTEATGFVHNVALRAALASEQRLVFNTNLRLLSAAGGIFNPNGKLFNGFMALLLVLSYSSSVLVTLEVAIDPREGGRGTTLIFISNKPLIVLAVTLALQVFIAVLAMVLANIRTWSSSPFDITAALVHHTQIIPVHGRCMHGVKDASKYGPLSPRKKQPSACRSHSSIRKVIIALWFLVAACFTWGFYMAHISAGNIFKVFTSWTFFSGAQSYVVTYPIPLHGKMAWFYWIIFYLCIIAIQAWMTFALHCSELVANVIRDEKVWRCATTAKGAKVSTNPLAAVYGSWLNIMLLFAKPMFREYLPFSFQGKLDF